MTGRWHTQTLAGGADAPPDERGDCVRACITSILGLPLDAVDNVHGDGWWDRLRGELHRHGYEIAILDIQAEPPADAYWIATLPSLNLGPGRDGKPSDHCVVARGYTLIHDPALGRRYDVDEWRRAWEVDKVSDGWALVPLDPAGLGPRGET